MQLLQFQLTENIRQTLEDARAEELNSTRLLNAIKLIYIINL